MSQVRQETGRSERRPAGAEFLATLTAYALGALSFAAVLVASAEQASSAAMFRYVGF